MARVATQVEMAAGGAFWVTKTVTSVNITMAGVDLTGASDGALAITDVIAQTNSLGIAGGTNLQLVANNASGLAAFFETAVAGLGANKTVNLSTASVTGIRSVLESGKKLTAKMTVANGSGLGQVTFYIKFERLTRSATVAPA